MTVEMAKRVEAVRSVRVTLRFCWGELWFWTHY